MYSGLRDGLPAAYAFFGVFRAQRTRSVAANVIILLSDESKTLMQMCFGSVVTPITLPSYGLADEYNDDDVGAKLFLPAVGSSDQRWLSVST